MSEDEFTTEYNSFSATARKLIASFPSINSMPGACIFPWVPPGYTRNASNYPLLPPIMPSPPLSDAYPARTLPTPQPPSPAQPAAVIVPVINNNQQQRRRRESTSDSNSEESYEPPTTRIRSRSKIAAITTRIPAEDHSKVKQLLQKYAPKLKYQRYPDHTTTRNVYETDLYNYFTTQSAKRKKN